MRGGPLEALGPFSVLGTSAPGAVAGPPSIVGPVSGPSCIIGPAAPDGGFCLVLHHRPGGADKNRPEAVSRSGSVLFWKAPGQNPSLKEETSQSSSPAAMSPASSVKSTKTHIVLKRVRHHPSP